MFLRAIRRKKDGKEHRYFSVVENRRVRSGVVVQRQVLYLGEINDSQQAAWTKSLEVFDEAEQRYATLGLFPDDREVPAEAIDSIRVKLSEMELRRPRAFGNCWLACHLWQQLGLDQFWQERLSADVDRETVPWEKVLELLVVNRHSIRYKGEWKLLGAKGYAEGRNSTERLNTPFHFGLAASRCAASL